jgi:hypothetical protein
VVDARGAALETIAGTKPEVLATIRDRWPDLPVEQVPFVAENPVAVPRRVQVTYTGRGEYTAFVLDEQDRELVRIQAGSLEEIRALLAARYPGLPVRVMPLRNPAAAAGRKKESAVSDRALRFRAAARRRYGPAGRPL